MNQKKQLTKQQIILISRSIGLDNEELSNMEGGIYIPNRNHIYMNNHPDSFLLYLTGYIDLYDSSSSVGYITRQGFQVIEKEYGIKIKFFIEEE